MTECMTYVSENLALSRVVSSELYRDRSPHSSVQEEEEASEQQNNTSVMSPIRAVTSLPEQTTPTRPVQTSLTTQVHVHTNPYVIAVAHHNMLFRR